jgi:exonuclease III
MILVCIKLKKLRGLKIASLNINSLLRHVDELRLMLSDSEIDVFAINESKIDNSVKYSEISIPVYNMILKDRNRFGGGVVVYIRETFSFYERKDLNSDDLEMICIEICKPRSRPFCITVWYRPPNSEMKLFDFFEIFLSKCDAESKELIVIGDINCNMIMSPKDSSTKKLIFLSALYNLEQLIKESTRVASTSSSLIDLVFTNQPNNISNSVVIDLGMSCRSQFNLCGEKSDHA